VHGAVQLRCLDGNPAAGRPDTDVPRGTVVTSRISPAGAGAGPGPAASRTVTSVAAGGPRDGANPQRALLAAPPARVCVWPLPITETEFRPAPGSV